MDTTDNHKEEFDLTVAGDFGDHCDFSAHIDHKKFRIDVTTNFDYKNYNDYEPFISSGRSYQIAIVDNKNFELQDIVDINFPICEQCNEGRLFDLGLLGNENITLSGNKTWSYDQVHFQYCNHCGELIEISRINTIQLPDFVTLQSQISEYAEGQVLKNISLYKSIFETKYAGQLSSIKNYLKSQFNKILFGLYSNSYTVINPQTAEGYRETKLYWQQNFLKGYIPLDFGDIVIE